MQSDDLAFTLGVFGLGFSVASPEQIEAVVQEMRKAWDGAIRAEALEEAAVVCDEHAARYEADMQIGDDDGTLECVAAALRGRASAIRALKEKKND